MAHKPLKKLKTIHRECIELEIQHPDWSAKKLGEELGVGVTSVWSWQHSPIYQEELDRRLKEEWKGAAKIAQRTMIQLSKNYNREASQYILKCLGYEPKQEVNLTTQDVIQIKITGDSDSDDN